jgi:hypothetical protein
MSRKYTMPVHCRGSQFEAINVVKHSEFDSSGQCALCNHKGSVTVTTGYSKRVHKHKEKNGRTTT